MTSHKKRKRGGATFRCGTCGKQTRVLRTTRRAHVVMRHRECRRGHRFFTVEELRS